METCFDYTDYKTACFSSDEPKWIRKIREWKEQFPDLIEILAEPEENDSCIYCRLPMDWFVVRPPRKLFMTDEDRAVAAERLRLNLGRRDESDN